MCDSLKIGHRRHRHYRSPQFCCSTFPVPSPQHTISVLPTSSSSNCVLLFTLHIRPPSTTSCPAISLCYALPPRSVAIANTGANFSSNTCKHLLCCCYYKSDPEASTLPLLATMPSLVHWPVKSSSGLPIYGSHFNCVCEMVYFIPISSSSWFKLMETCY